MQNCNLLFRKVRGTAPIGFHEVPCIYLLDPFGLSANYNDSRVFLDRAMPYHHPQYQPLHQEQTSYSTNQIYHFNGLHGAICAVNGLSIAIVSLWEARCQKPLSIREASTWRHSWDIAGRQSQWIVCKNVEKPDTTIPVPVYCRLTSSLIFSSENSSSESIDSVSAA